MNFGEHIRVIRKDLGMTQKVLAARADIAQPGLAQIERGRRASEQTIIRICRVLDIPLVLLIFMGVEKEYYETDHERFKILYPALMTLVIQLIEEKHHKYFKFKAPNYELNKKE